MSKTELKRYSLHVLLAQEVEDNFILVFAQFWSAAHQLTCHVHHTQRATNIDGLLKDVSAFITGLPGLVLVLAMSRNTYQLMVIID